VFARYLRKDGANTDKEVKLVTSRPKSPWLKWLAVLAIFLELFSKNFDGALSLKSKVSSEVELTCKKGIYKRVLGACFC